MASVPLDPDGETFPQGGEALYPRPGTFVSLGGPLKDSRIYGLQHFMEEVLGLPEVHTEWQRQPHPDKCLERSEAGQIEGNRTKLQGNPFCVFRECICEPPLVQRDPEYRRLLEKTVDLVKVHAVGL